MKELIRTERETEKLLTPSVLPELKKYAGYLKTAFNNYLGKIKNDTTNLYQKQRNRIRPNFKIQQNLKAGKKIVNFRIGEKIGANFEKFGQPIFLALRNIFLAVKNLPFWNKLILISKNLFGNLLVKFKRLPPSSRILLIITLILVILFSQSLIWLGIKNYREKAIEHFNQTIVDVETKKNNAESSLIYRDEGQARQLLIEAKNLLAELKPSSSAQREQVAILTKETEDQLQKLRHLVEVAEPIQIVNFQNLDSETKIADVLVANQNFVYTQNYNNQAIYKANLNTRVISAIHSSTVNLGNIILGATISNTEIVFLNNSMAAFRLNPASETLETVAISINDKAKIVDFITYNNRLYLLDTATSQIIRYTKTATGYGNPTNWLKETIDLSMAKSFTIDGSIYLLKNNGEIIKFDNGQLSDFKVKIIDPALQAPTKIKTAETSNYLYILDPPTKRLVVIGKDGNLISQYTSPAFTDLKDFIVNEADKKIYLLNGSSIFGVPAEHLK